MKNIDSKKNEIYTKEIVKEKSQPKKDKTSKKNNESMKTKKFKPQPYRIILRLSGSNPSAPAEKVTNALRKAGIEFEVEKIERFEQRNLIKNTSFKR